MVLNTQYLFFISIGIVLLAVFISKYIQLSKNRNQIENAISTLNTLLNERSDLILDLLDFAEQRMSLAHDLIEKITVLSTANLCLEETLENEGSVAVKNVFVEAEKYPELKYNTILSHFEYTWDDLEGKISSKRFYIDQLVAAHNNSIVIFPTAFVSKLLGFNRFDWLPVSKQLKKNLNPEPFLKNN
ncbi:MAG: LemA protein [Crocinitomix sp.]|jgi:LemA protein